jgi:hypothetical protein
MACYGGSLLSYFHPLDNSPREAVADLQNAEERKDMTLRRIEL